MYETSERYFLRVLAVCGAITAAIWLATATQFVDGVDLYVFICHSRDMISGTAPKIDSAYRYFPGIYSFWRSVLFLFGHDTLVIQTAVVSVVAINGVLTGAISRQLTKSLPHGILGGLLYLCFASRYECTMGTAEPLATIPFLIGIWLWCSNTPRLRVSWNSLILLGVALALSVYCKQQAGLLSLGVGWLAVANLRVQPTQRIAMRTTLTQVTAIATAAAVTLLIAILIEGRGIEPLQRGLQMAAGYSAKGTWFSNCYSIIRNDESVAFVILLAVGGLFLAAQKTWEPEENRNSFLIVGILLSSALATTIQFRTRGYYHYFLLAIPGLVIAFVFTLFELSSRFRKATFRDRCARGLVFLAGVVPFLHAGQRPDDFEIWSPHVSAANFDEPRPWHMIPETLDEIAELRSLLSGNRQVVVLPPVRTVTYLLLEASQPNGYAFGGPSCLDGVNWTGLDAAIVFESLDDRETANWQETRCDSAMLLIKKHNLCRVHQGTRFSLWQRVDDE